MNRTAAFGALGPHSGGTFVGLALSERVESR